MAQHWLQQRGNTSYMRTNLTTQHAVNLHKCTVFDMLLNDGGNCQSRACETPMRIDKGIDKKFNRWVILLMESESLNS